MVNSLSVNFWYALQCPTGQEAFIRQFLNRAYPQFPTLLPRRELVVRRAGKWSLEERPLFPGYLLLNSHASLTRQEAKAIIQNAIPPTKRSFTRFVELAKIPSGELALPHIQPYEMSFILELCRAGEKISLSQFVKEGERIRVVAGPLQGREGQIVALNLRKKRAKVKLIFLAQEYVVDLGLEQLSQDMVSLH